MLAMTGNTPEHSLPITLSTGSIPSNLPSQYREHALSIPYNLRTQSLSQCDKTRAVMFAMIGFKVLMLKGMNKQYQSMGKFYTQTADKFPEKCYK